MQTTGPEKTDQIPLTLARVLSAWGLYAFAMFIIYAVSVVLGSPLMWLWLILAPLATIIILTRQWQNHTVTFVGVIIMWLMFALLASASIDLSYGNFPSIDIHIICFILLEVGLPAPVPMMLIFAAVSTEMYRRSSKHPMIRSRKAGTCTQCCYPLTGLPTSRCPECGKVNTSSHTAYHVTYAQRATTAGATTPREGVHGNVQCD